ncbi:hypothetical protein [Dialister succinatiphilus]|uniref:hypothetical protein n=1 Tax=Dialister succinatiphilus TaxID=487173 RepID=UPI003AAF8551
MMKKGEKNQGGLKVHDFFHSGYSKMYFKPAEESFFSGEGEWQVIEQVRCLRNPFTNLHYDEENFKRLVSMLRSMKDDEFQNVPPFLQNGLREAYDMMPEDLQKHCVKLWKWKV